jgi:hypothetical protein
MIKYVFKFSRESKYNSDKEEYSFDISHRSSEDTAISGILPFSIQSLIPLIKQKIDIGYDFLGIEKHTPYEVYVCTIVENFVREKLNLTEIET